MATFHQLRDAVYKDLILSLDYFAEQVLLIENYGRVENEAISLQVAIQQARDANSFITVSITEIEEDPDIDGSRFSRYEELWVKCARDPAAVNSKSVAIGGIDGPNLHLAILRDVSRDPLQLPYTYANEIEDSTDVLWRLKFNRMLQGVQDVRA